MKIKLNNEPFIRQQHKIVLLLILVICFNMKTFSQSSEYTMKAIAFEKLSLFVTWQADALKNNPSQEFVIAVFGQHPFGDILDEVYKNKKIKNRKVKIVYVNNIKQLKDCQILFVSKTSLNELQKVLNYVKGKSVLTISDTDGFAKAGCMINFYLYENKLHFEINQKVMIDEGFTIDYLLLRVCKIINPISV
jgi:hypothetical protein